MFWHVDYFCKTFTSISVNVTEWKTLQQKFATKMKVQCNQLNSIDYWKSTGIGKEYIQFDHICNITDYINCGHLVDTRNLV